MAQKNNIARPIDLTSEVSGTLPLVNCDPTLQSPVQNYYSLGTLGADGQAITIAKDSSNDLPFYRLKGGANITISQSGNSLLITGSSSVGGSGDMLKSVYDVDNDGVVNEARLADSCQWGNLIGTPATFAPTPSATWPESQITGNTIAGATGGLTGDLGAVVPKATLVNTRYSLTGGGSLAASLTLNLVGDVATPGNNQYYATNGSGVRAWYPDPYLAGGMAVSVFATNGHTGWVDVAVLANSVGAGAVSAGGLAAGAVTAPALATGAVGASKLATGAIVGSLGYTPLNKAGDIMSGALQVNKTGGAINTATWQNAHLLLQTSGAGTGAPVLGFGYNIGSAAAAGVAIYWAGSQNDFQLIFSNGTQGTLLSSLSILQGSHLASGSITSGALAANSVTRTQIAAGAVGQDQIAVGSVGNPQLGNQSVSTAQIFPGAVGAGQLAVGAAAANIGFPLINPAAANTISGTLLFTHPTGLAAGSYVAAPILISNNGVATARAGIGFVNQGQTGIYLYLNEPDGKLHFIDNSGVDHVITSS